MPKKTEKKIKYHMGNEKLPMGGQSMEYEAWQLKEIAKCKKDILYFAQKYFYIVDPDEGEQIIKLFPYQKRLLQTIQENRFTICLSARQSGKCVVEDTMITVRNKKSGMVEKIRIGDLYRQVVNQ